MPKELRRRPSRPNYAVLLSYDDQGEDDIGADIADEADSGSEFSPGKGPAQANQEDDGNSSGLSDLEEDEDMLEGLSSSDVGNAAVKPSKPIGVKKSAAQTPRTSRHSAVVLPSIHHRHRAVPLYRKDGTVQRLLKKPRLFHPSELALTNSWSTHNVGTRVAKAWGYNVGPGPLWDLLEDRGWYSESMKQGNGADENERRPRVYLEPRIQSPADLILLADAEASLYRRKALNGSLEPQPSIKCFFGEYGNQQQKELHRFSRLAMENLFPQSIAHVFNAGAPVWALDWCPIHPDDRGGLSGKQYLAVAPLPSYDYSPQIGIKVARPNPACIQVWSLNPPSGSHVKSEPLSHGANSGFMKCELVLCIDTGPAHDLKWCPLPSNEPINGLISQAYSPRRLGLLAGAFEDGSVSIFSVLYPEDVLSEAQVAGADEPAYVKVSDPLVRLELEETACWSIDWANSEVIAVGCSNGCIAVYDIADALQSRYSGKAPLPTYYSSVHQTAIRSVAWVRTPTLSPTGELTSDDPNVVISSSYDGLVAATDIHAPCSNVVYRTRDVVNSVCYSPYAGGPISVDQGQVKVTSFAPSMLNKGHAVIEPDGPVWSLNASDYHPQLAIGVADGSCRTTNTLRNTRRGGTVPFTSHIVYQLDYSRETGEYRMLEHFLPKEIEKVIGTKTKASLKAVGAWSPQISVTRVVWNNGNGLGNASLLASATASGLCRVDWLTGRWSKNRIPYDGIEGIRKEVEADEEMDEDSE